MVTRIHVKTHARMRILPIYSETPSLGIIVILNLTVLTPLDLLNAALVM
jgi:hypothetical protein